MSTESWWGRFHNRFVCVFLTSPSQSLLLLLSRPYVYTFDVRMCMRRHMHACLYLEEILIKLCGWMKYEEQGDFIKSLEWWSSSQTPQISLYLSTTLIQQNNSPKSLSIFHTVPSPPPPLHFFLLCCRKLRRTSLSPHALLHRVHAIKIDSNSGASEIQSR